jgi:hypothetical protein
MTEEQWDLAYELDEELTIEIRNLVEAKLEGRATAVQEAVRERLTEGFSFWERRMKC